jgi:hypothetical protein
MFFIAAIAASAFLAIAATYVRFTYPFLYDRKILTGLFWMYFREKVARWAGIGYVDTHAINNRITYYHGNKPYTIVFPKNRGPCPWIKVTDGNDRDVTEEVSHFAGFAHNFHGVNTTPDSLNLEYNGLTFHTLRGAKLTFCHDDIIDLLAIKLWQHSS